MSPAGLSHGEVDASLTIVLGSRVKANGLGRLFCSSAGFWMKSGNLRSPDLSFVAAHRFPLGVPKGFSEIPPDLAVEVLSPEESERTVLGFRCKLREILPAVAD